MATLNQLLEQSEIDAIIRQRLLPEHTIYLKEIRNLTVNQLSKIAFFVMRTEGITTGTGNLLAVDALNILCKRAIIQDNHIF